MAASSAPDTLVAAASALHTLVEDIERYIANPPPGDRYVPPVIDWHHPDEYTQAVVGGLSKFLNHVAKERAIVDAVVASPHPPADYSTNLVSLQGVWDAFLRAPRPLVGIWQVLDRRAGEKSGATKVDVVAAGGEEWVKVNTIKASRLLVEFREQDSYVNSDYDSDDSESPAAPELNNSLLAQARAIVEAAALHPRLSSISAPHVRFVLTRLEPSPSGGHPDPRIPATFEAMRALGVEVEFVSDWPLSLPAQLPVRPLSTPGTDIVLDLSVLIALCCDSTHHPLPADEEALEARFRLQQPDGTAAPHTGASRDLRDQLASEMARPLIRELRTRLETTLPPGASPRFWVTREVRKRLPSLVDVIGGVSERARAAALFDQQKAAKGAFWLDSRWAGDTGILQHIHVRVLEDADDAPAFCDLRTPFDRVVEHVCSAMLAASDESVPEEPSSGAATPPSQAPLPPAFGVVSGKPKREGTAPRSGKARAVGACDARASSSPLRTATMFPPASRLPSGHTLRTLLAGVSRGATVLTNNRGAVLKVLREAGVLDGIPYGDEEGIERARIWVVNPASLAEWRRLEVEESVKGLQG